MKIRPVGAELLHADGRTDRYAEASGSPNSIHARYSTVALIKLCC
jgi:hypothetical protein